MADKTKPTERVAVYGTLRRSGHNYTTMSAAKGAFLGDFWTPPRYCMYDYGGFPAVALDGMESILVEVYRVDSLEILDQLEGYPDLYDRIEIPTPYGPSWLYHMDRNQVALTCPQVKSGNWIAYDIARQRSPI